jgi:hypothetical protein
MNLVRSVHLYSPLSPRDGRRDGDAPNDARSFLMVAPIATSLSITPLPVDCYA